MKKNLTKLIVLCCMFVLGLSNNAIAQCTLTAGGPYTNLQTPPCGTNCGTPTTAAFEVWGNEAYLVNGIAGSEYVFQFCTGYSAATWPATITVAEWTGTTPGAVIGTVDGCSYTFVTPSTGTYVVYVSITADCGGAEVQTDNGLPTLDCGPNGAACPSGPCEAGVLTSPLTQTACLGTVDSTFIIALDGTQVSDGGFTIYYDNTGTDGQGGTGNPVNIIGYTAAEFPFTGDEDLGGTLSFNNLPPFVGTWNVTVYALDALGTVCDSTAIMTVGFCPSGPCEAGTLTSVTSQVICTGAADSTFTIVLDGTEVSDGGFSLGFDNSPGGTGALGESFSLSNISFPVTYDNDLNGLLSANLYPVLAGTWDITVYALDANEDICDSTAVTTVEFLDAADPACTPVACPLTPTNHSVVMTSPTTAFFDWDNMAGAVKYQVFHRLKGETNPWTIASSGAASQKSIEFTNKRNWQYKLRTQCEDLSWSPFTEVVAWYSSQCEVPTGVAVTFTDLNRMRVRWDANPDEVKAKIRYRVVGGDWVLQNSADGNNFLWVNGLPSGATIQYKVRSNCDGNDWSAYSSPLQTVTLGSTTRESQVVSETTLSPNPANEVLNLAFNIADASEVTIRISDNLGKEVLSMNNTYQEGTQRETLDISRLANGYYFVTIYSNDNVETLKFVKSK
jgi:hypothetical protein